MRACSVCRAIVKRSCRWRSSSWGSFPVRFALYISKAQGLDFTIAHPLTTAHVAAASRSSGAAASNLEKSKHRSYGAICAQHDITLNPIGSDIFGAYGPDAVAFIKRLSVFISERRGTSPREEEQRLYERSTVALHSLQSRMISTRLVE